MRVSSFINFRTSFLFAALLCFAGAVAPRSLDYPALTNPRHEPMNDFAILQTRKPAVTAGDFSISANPTALTVPIQNPGNTSGGVVDGTLTLTGLNGFDGNVNLSCMITGGSGVNQPACFFPALGPADQILVDASDPASTTTIEADTVAGSCNAPVFCVVPNIFGGVSGKFQTTALVLVLLTFSSCFAGFLSKRIRARLLCAVFICTAGLAMAGCSNGPSASSAEGCPPGLGFTPGTPAGTYMMTVAATSGNLIHSVTIPVTVPAQ
jgi:hypothetical protein|nr:hypothetical protein [Candidatus Acidoferrales bacterium]